MAAIFKKGIDGNGQRAVNFSDASGNTDLVTLQQVYNLIRGWDWKREVVAQTTGNINLSAPGSSIDGVAISAAMQSFPELGNVTRVLVDKQSTAGQNGIYDWNGAASAMTRSVDADSWAELAGATVTVMQGTANGDKTYKATGNETGTLGTTDPAFVAVGGGSAYTAGNGLQLGGSAFSILLDSSSGLSVSGTGLKIDTSVVRRKGAANCVVTTNPQAFAHGAGNADVNIDVYESGVRVYPDISVDATNITIDWGSA